jgi:hypothetical protein
MHRVDEKFQEFNAMNTQLIVARTFDMLYKMTNRFVGVRV